MPLRFPNIDVLPAIEPSIDGPGTRSDHCQRRAKAGQYDCNPGIAGTRESDPQLSDSYQSSGDWGPQADEKKYARSGCNDWRGHECKLMCITKVHNPIMYESKASQEPNKQKATAGPTVREVRE